MKAPTQATPRSVDMRLHDARHLLNLVHKVVDPDRLQASPLDDEDAFAVQRAVEMASDILLDIWNTTPPELLAFTPEPKGGSR
jgi:hypothetical protein